MAAHRRRRTGKPHRNTRSAHAAGRRMIDFGDETKMPDDRIREDLVERVDRTDRHVGFAEAPHDVRFRERTDPPLDDRNDVPSVCTAFWIVGEAPVLEQLLKTQRPTE